MKIVLTQTKIKSFVSRDIKKRECLEKGHHTRMRTRRKVIIQGCVPGERSSYKDAYPENDAEKSHAIDEWKT